MNLELWKSRVGWLTMAAAILIAGRLAQAEPDASEAVLLTEEGDVLKERPWLGLQCFPADPAIRAQLKLPAGTGLVVGSVAPDSPAAKAGVQANDILLKAGEQPLKEVADLVAAIEKSVGAAMKIELLREGETKTIEVTPGGRAIKIEPYSDRGIVDRWLERMPRVVEGLPERIRFFRAGTPFAAPFPKDLTLSIQKEGDQPAKIVAKQGDEQWETTEDKLGELPDKIRGPIELFLGKIPTVLPDGSPVVFPLPQPTPETAAEMDRAVERGRDYLRRQAEQGRRRVADAEQRIRDEKHRVLEEAAPHVERATRRIEELEKQLLERLEQLDRKLEERTKALEAVPAKPAEPAQPAEPAGPALPTPEST